MLGETLTKPRCFPSPAHPFSLASSPDPVTSVVIYVCGPYNKTGFHMMTNCCGSSSLIIGLLCREAIDRADSLLRIGHVLNTSWPNVNRILSSKEQTTFEEIRITIKKHLQENLFKMSTAKCQPFYSGPNAFQPLWNGRSDSIVLIHCLAWVWPDHA